MSLHERLKTFINHKGLTYKKFEMDCGFGNGTAKRFNEKIKRRTLDSITLAFPDLNIAWLLTGEGEMLRKEEDKPVLIPDTELHADAEGNYRMVPVIHIDSVGGIHSENDILSPEYVERYIPIAGAKRNDVLIHHTGNSMSPAIPPGSLLLIREVPEWYEYIGYGDVFVLLLRDERRITKEIRRYDEDPKNYYWCVSYNPDLADEELPKKFISRVWKVIKVLIDKGW